MKSKFSKNHTDKGYLMDYRKGIHVAPFNTRVLQFKIELPEIVPLIWRRIVVPSDYNLWDLHVAIQDSMGWLDYHLHQFIFKGRGKKAKVKIGIPDFEQFYEGELDEVFPGWEIPVLTYFNDLGKTAQYLYYILGPSEAVEKSVFGKVNDMVMTVRFIYRNSKIRMGVFVAYPVTLLIYL